MILNQIKNSYKLIKYLILLFLMVKCIYLIYFSFYKNNNLIVQLLGVDF